MTTALMLLVGAGLVLAGALAGRPFVRATKLAPLGHSVRGAIAATGLMFVVAGLILLGGDGASAKPGQVQATVEAELASDEISEEIRVFLDGHDMGVVRVDRQAAKARLAVTVPGAGRHDYRVRSTRQVSGRQPVKADGAGQVVVAGKGRLGIFFSPDGKVFLLAL